MMISTTIKKLFYVFKVRFECLNCGNKWEEGFGEMIRVRKQGSQVQVQNYEKDEPGKFGYIRCPVCELMLAITIIGRTPMYEEEDS